MTIHFELTEHRDDGTGEAISAVNATEWLIPIEVVKQIAAEYNLQLVMNTRFDQFLYQLDLKESFLIKLHSLISPMFYRIAIMMY